MAKNLKIQFKFFFFFKFQIFFKFFFHGQRRVHQLVNYKIKIVFIVMLAEISIYLYSNPKINYILPEGNPFIAPEHELGVHLKTLITGNDAHN